MNTTLPSQGMSCYPPDGGAAPGQAAGAPHTPPARHTEGAHTPPASLAIPGPQAVQLFLLQE